MSRKKTRGHRWDLRENLKLKANRFQERAAMHPQVRRELAKAEAIEEEYILPETDAAS